MNFDGLDYQQFELLIGLLLARESYELLQIPSRNVQTGPDFVAVGPDGALAIFEVKHFRRTSWLPTTLVTRFSDEAARFRGQHPNAHAILVTSGDLNKPGKAIASSGRLEVWDRDRLKELLKAHPDVATVVEGLRTARGDAVRLLEALKQPARPATRRSESLATELKAIQPGRAQWRAYELLGTRTLSDIFSPHLGSPEVQSRSDDGLDIMDAVFPVRGTTPPWSIVRSEYRSRFAVAEFKNHVEPVGQREVESIAQYLYDKAFRQFGLLVARNGFNESAVLARRRAWVGADNLIVLLQDQDLIEMTQLWEDGQDPFQIIDAQLEDFFRKLNP